MGAIIAKDVHTININKDVRNFFLILYLKNNIKSKER